MAVAVNQHQGFKPPVRSQRCRLPSFNHLDFFLLDSCKIDAAQSLTLTTPSFHRSSSTPCLTLTTKAEEEFNENSRVELIGSHCIPRVQALVVEVAIVLASGVDPLPVSSGFGGAYFLCNRNGDTVAVAKPIDEEPLALNNPKGFTGRMLGRPGLKRSVRVGETGMREVAAYLLDYGGFAGVPPTALVKFSHVTFHVNNPARVSTPPYKIASLQRYVDHDSDAGDLGPSGFSVSSVHRIGILDIRLLNIDRHSGNILVCKCEQDKYSFGAIELVPIDHGLCLPEWLDDPYFEWLHWPQSSVPFSEVEMHYIRNLDPFEDAKLLRTKLPCLGESSIRVLIVCTIFLKRAASAGLCLGDIGEMMTRDCLGGEETMSTLERICARAKAIVSILLRDDAFGNREEIKEEEEEDDFQTFQLDEECIDSTRGIPVFQSSGKPPLALKSQRPYNGMACEMKSGLLLEHKSMDVYNQRKQSFNVEDIEIKSNENRKGGCLFKSLSFAAPRKNEIEGISFGEMNTEEWEIFLDMFERLLPEAFEERKCTGITQKVGSA